MKYRGIAAFLLCFAMLTGTGCSFSLKKSESGGNTLYSSSAKSYDVNGFTFEASEDLKTEDTKEIDGKINEYMFSGNGIKKLEVTNYDVNYCTAEVSIQSIENDIKRRRNDPVKEYETEKLDVPGFNAAAIHIVNDGNDDYCGESELYITIEGRSLVITAIYDLDDKDDVKALMLDIAKSAKYTDDFRLPTEPQTYDCDLFSLTCGPEWELKDRNKNNEQSEEREISLRYIYAQDLEHYYYPQLTVTAVPKDEKNNIERFIEKSIKSAGESKFKSEPQRDKEEILGYTADTLTYDVDISSLSLRIKNFYFSANGYVYIISFDVNKNAIDANTADLQELIGNLNIKQLSDEEVAKRKQAHEEARYTAYTFHGASFELASEMKPNRELDDSKRYADFSDYGMSLTVRTDVSSSAEKALENDYAETALDANETERDDNDHSPRDLEKGNVKIGSYDIPYFSFVEPENYSHYYDKYNTYYYLEANGKVWKFEFGFSEDDREDGKDIVEKFFESLDLSGVK